MALRLHLDSKTGQCTLRGIRPDFARYERDIISGKKPCPFTVVFLDTRYKRVVSRRDEYGRAVLLYKVVKEGEVISRGPVPLAPDGAPKTPLFQV